ncbi:MAG: hypothetical protein AAFR99_17290 [Cyanobacteria bacterium J06629_9]
MTILVNPQAQLREIGSCYLSGQVLKELKEMNTSDWLWNELHYLFDTNDGSLPEIHVNYTNAEATVEGYALIRQRASRVVTESPYFWSKIYSKEMPLDSVENAARLVVSEEAECFHVVFGGIRYENFTIPDLRVYVFTDQLALDYRMGDEWGPGELNALFLLLAKLVHLDTEANLSLEKHVPPSIHAHFHNCWQLWISKHNLRSH